MNRYDYLSPYKAKDWTNSKKWLHNRCLFLLSLQDRNPVVFYGADEDTPEEQYQAWLHSYARELNTIKTQYNDIYKKAWSAWINDEQHGKISYME